MTRFGALRSAPSGRLFDRARSPVRGTVLDTSFDEDRAKNRKDHGPENLAIQRP